MTLVLSDEQQILVRAVAGTVAGRYRAGKIATMKYMPKTTDIEGVNLNGFGAELAVAAAIGGRWNEGDPRKADIGEDVQVRQSRYDDARLLLYDYDNQHHRFVLVTGAFPIYVARGWLYGMRGMLPQWRHEKGTPAPFRVTVTVAADTGLWAVDQVYLWPFEVLRP